MSEPVVAEEVDHGSGIGSFGCTAWKCVYQKFLSPNRTPEFGRDSSQRLSSRMMMMVVVMMMMMMVCFDMT